MSVKFLRKSEILDSEVCWQGLNLLGHAQMIELFIGSKCGGHGECGADRVRLRPEDQAKVNAPGAVEKSFLSAEELASGVRIACQCFPNEDGLSIQVEMLSRQTKPRNL
jgi:ferredoxin